MRSAIIAIFAAAASLAAIVAANAHETKPIEPIDEPRICGGLAGLACAEGQFCDYSIEANCGIADAAGICQPRPVICMTNYSPVCGCDGKTYGNACEAAAAGVGQRRAGACEAQQ